MELSLENTQVKLMLKIGTSESTLFSNAEGFCDNEWHMVKIIREGTRVILQVDNDEPATSMFDDDSSLENSLEFEFDFLEIGFSSRTIAPMTYRSLAYDSINLASHFIKHKSSGQISVRTTGSFVGQMQQLIINGRSYFELIDNGDLVGSVNRTATFIRSDLPNKYPLSFANNSSLSLPKIDAFHTLLIQFHFKTTHPNGLIFFNRGIGNDFLVIELYAGQIVFAFNLDKKINRIKSHLKDKLNDNKWHLVSIWRSTKTNFELTVDSIVYKLSLENTNESLELNLIDNLYIGGIRNRTQHEYFNANSGILSHNGFKGCLASIEINGRVPDFDEYLNNMDKISGSITKGCENAFDCLESTCKNGGVCLENWDENKKSCDCSSTTYTGEYCESRSKGYEIKNAVINFEYKSPMYWQEDSLTFGIETRTKDALLFRAYSGRTNKTILVELNDGYAQAIFVDLHGTTYLHTFKNYRINNNRYHIFKMKVFDFNSSFSIDDNIAKKEITNENKYDPLKKYRNLLINNDQNLIQIEIAGSKQYVDNKPTDLNEAHFFNNFNGKIYGLVYNKFRILDLLALKDSRIKTIGGLELIDQGDIDDDSIEYESESDGENSLSEFSLVSASSITRTTTTTELKKDRLKTTMQNSDLENKSTKQMITEKMTEITSQVTAGNLTNTNKANSLDESFFSTNYVIFIVIGSTFLIIALIYAFCKYRNLDEGTYTIDESKNCGPFAELDTPLNGMSKSGKKIKNKRKNMLNANNKEWYV